VPEAVKIYDTTLRDGCQGAGVSLSLQDKLDIAQSLDAFCVDYVEGGWPGANPKDTQFFAALREQPLRNAEDESGRPALILERHGSLDVDDVRELVAKHGFGLVLADGAWERVPMRGAAMAL
jgi:isopropylmalate/homocitrate/citramalate synthase